MRFYKPVYIQSKSSLIKKQNIPVLKEQVYFVSSLKPQEMDHLKILVVEDTSQESKLLVEILEAHGFKVVGVATTYREALSIFLSKDIDLAIIDIFLNGHPDGIRFAEAIDILPDKIKPFFFLTSSTSRIIFDKAKLTHPYAYLIKPYNELELIYTVEKAIEKFYGQDEALSIEGENAVISQEYLFIKKGKSLKKVKVSEIIYVEVEEKYCNIVTEKEKFVILISLVKILEMLDSTKFCRTHRNFIVNTEKIEEIVPSDNLILLSGDHKATLSDKYKDIIKKIRTLR